MGYFEDLLRHTDRLLRSAESAIRNIKEVGKATKVSFDVPTVEKKKIDNVIVGIKYLSSPPKLGKMFALDNIKQRTLDFLKANFPESPRRRKRAHYRSGFRAYDIPETGGKVGFTVGHVKISDHRVAAVLKSLETGSRAWILKTGRRLKMTYGRRNRPGDDFAMIGKWRGSKWTPTFRVKIPARKGIRYMGKTFQYVQGLIKQAKPSFFEKVRAIIRS